jgi:hypothetical protein
MDAQDRDTLERFGHRFAGIEAELKDRPPFDLRRRAMPGLTRRSRSLAIAFAVVAVVVAAVALGQLVTIDRSPGPSSNPGVVVASSSPTPDATPSPEAPTAPTVMVGDWTVRCVDVQEADCVGAAERFINLLARSTSGVFDRSGGVLSVEPRPVCPWSRTRQTAPLLAGDRAGSDSDDW